MRNVKCHARKKERIIFIYLLLEDQQKGLSYFKYFRILFIPFTYYMRNYYNYTENFIILPFCSKFPVSLKKNKYTCIRRRKGYCFCFILTDILPVSLFLDAL